MKKENFIPSIRPEEVLASKDKIMAKLISFYGNSKIVDEKRDLFDGLMQSIISQQLSNKASSTISLNLENIHGSRPFKPEKILSIEDIRIRQCGISYAKIRSIKSLADSCLKNELSMQLLEAMTDDEVYKKLTSYWGIGSWTAEIFMMFGLKRLNVLAKNDAGLIRAHKKLYPNSPSIEFTSINWSPYKAVAAWYLWKYLDSDQQEQFNEMLIS
ncbi:DNA-3-methyladenine glycosylase 2 family protein [Polynucleobacter paneuropaeus]|nr:DNA-3-methyladenine glycosylase 2 family protein [Polynucleobacter paneuropaeus]